MCIENIYKFSDKIVINFSSILKSNTEFVTTFLLKVNTFVIPLLFFFDSSEILYITMRISKETHCVSGMRMWSIDLLMNWCLMPTLARMWSIDLLMNWCLMPTLARMWSRCRANNGSSIKQFHILNYFLWLKKHFLLIDCYWFQDYLLSFILLWQ